MVDRFSCKFDPLCACTSYYYPPWRKLDQADPGPYLSACGLQRSLALPDYFIKNFPVPCALFAQAADKLDASLRPIQTLAPTAMRYAALYPKQADSFTAQTQHSADQVKSLAELLLSAKAYDGGTIIVCWSHGHITQLAKWLGVPHPPDWDSKVYNQVWVITWDQKTKKIDSFTIKTQPFGVSC